MNPLRSFSREEEGDAFVSIPEDEEGDLGSERRTVSELSQSYRGNRQQLGPLSPQNSILDEEDNLRHQEQNQSIRRRRLFVRPAVVFVLGFFVFRYTNNKRGFFFGSGANNRYQNGLRLGGSSVVEEKVDNHELAGASLFQGDPSASIFNVVSDMNDDDSNDDLPVNRGPVRLGIATQQNISREGENNESNRKSKHKTKKDKDKSSYGWVPEVYPDPMIDPVRCGIAYLTAENENLQTGQTAEEERRGGLILNSQGGNATKEEEDDGGNDSPSLRLCDPDWVLGGVYLEEIAQKMSEFSNRFTPRDLGPILPKNQLLSQKPEDDQGLTLAVATVRKVGFVLFRFFGEKMNFSSITSTYFHSYTRTCISKTNQRIN